MPEPFMYGVIASILHKIENSDHFFISDDKKSNLKTDLIKLISDVKAQNYYPREILGELKKVLYDLDDIIDAEMSENYVADIDKVLVKLRWEINGRSSFQAYWARYHMVWRSTGGKYLPEKLEWRDAGLAACFAYCALYPKGHVISRENLVNQWLANGFVLPSGDEDFEDAGNRYFNLLLSRGAFQDVRFAFGANRSNNQAAIATVVSCHMHPDAYDEACQIAGQDIQIISDQMSVCLNCKYAALDIINWENFEFEKFQKTTLRALLVFAANSKLLERLFHDTSPILENLCVLDLTGMHVVDVQWLRGCSRSLRYLSLSHNLNLLLLSIFRHCLQLQTLVLDRCSLLYRPHLFELGRLRHLYLTIREEYIPGLHQLTALRILELSGCAKLRLLSEGTTKYATTLRILRIFDCPRLVSLGTGKESLPSSIEEIIFHNCPSLFLSNGRAMNELLNLQRLELIGLDKLVELPVGLQTAIRLQYVMIANCIKLKSLIDVLGHLKSLEILCIYNCSKLLGLPEVVHSLSSLQSLHIRGCPNLYNQLEKCTKDRAFIAHIPDIDIQLPDIDIDLQDHDMESQSSILPYFTMKNIMSEKARYSYDPKKKPANKRSKWDNLALVLSAIKSMQASVRETYRIEGEKRKRERELFEKQEQLLEEPKLMCSLFPGGSEIERETLIQLWMAGGLLKNVYINFEGYLVDSRTEGDALEYYGSLYLQTLENTGFLLPSTLDKSKYRVNPDNNLHGKTQSANRYCQLKEENGVVCAPPPPPSSSSSVTPRHVSLTLTSDHVDEAALFKTLKEFEGLKTLLLMGSSSLKHVPSDFFTTLKVLSYTLIERLPESTDCLQELQTLKLNGCKHLVELPPGLKNLIRLRHLYFDDLTKVARMPRGLSELTELQTLSAFIVDDSDNGCNIEELKSLNNLTGSLCVSGLENVPLDYAGQNILRHKMHVVQLQLTWKPTTDSDEEEFIEELKPNACLEELHISCYPCKKLPNWMADGNEFRKLARIQLLNCQNTEFNTPLGQLPGLQYLEIIQMNRVETLDECFRGDEDTDVAYSNLDTLIIEGMDSLLSWNEIQSQDFPKLSKLVIKQCPNLTKFPFLPHIVGSLKHLEINSTGIQELPLPQKLSLQTLKIINCPSLEEKCSTGGEYWDQIRDIPEILFSEDADTSIARTFGDNKLADTIAFGSEAKPSKEMLPLVPGEKDLKLLTGDYELEKERLSPGSEDSTKDGSSADKIAWQTMDDYREEKERPVMDGQDVTRDESLANKTNI